MDSMKKEPTYYESVRGWLEDTYLKYFGENRTSYGVKDSLKKTQVTGNKDIDDVQEATGEMVGNTFGERGLLGVVGGGMDKNVLKGNV